MTPMPVMPTLRHSTKLSVIEGAVDEHGTASESTPELCMVSSRIATFSSKRFVMPWHMSLTTSVAMLTLARVDRIDRRSVTSLPRDYLDRSIVAMTRPVRVSMVG
jgi:hypothetical protein